MARFLIASFNLKRTLSSLLGMLVLFGTCCLLLLTSQEPISASTNNNFPLKTDDSNQSYPKEIPEKVVVYGSSMDIGDRSSIPDKLTGDSVVLDQPDMNQPDHGMEMINSASDVTGEDLLDGGIQLSESAGKDAVVKLSENVVMDNEIISNSLREIEAPTVLMMPASKDNQAKTLRVDSGSTSVLNNHNSDKSSFQFNYFHGKQSIWPDRPPFVIWNADLHSSPVEAFKHLVAPLGVRVIHHALDSRCSVHFKNNCGEDSSLRVLNQATAKNLTLDTIKAFYQTYKEDAELLSVDAFLCFHPAANCELYLPFNKSLLVVASNRYALGRYTPTSWHHWNHQLQVLQPQLRHLVAATNYYDIEYMRYYSGVEAEYLPMYCAYPGSNYAPTLHGQFLVMAGRYPDGITANYFGKEWNNACAKVSCDGMTAVHIKTLANPFKFAELIRYQAIIHIPYQVSSMSICEQYRMAIPLFFPTLEYLTQLDMKNNVVNERNCKSLSYCWKNHSSCDMPPFDPLTRVPNPHDKTRASAVRYWLELADFYKVYPHITYFNSVEDLVVKLKLVDYQAISAKMMAFNSIHQETSRQKWRDALKKVGDQRRS